MAQARAHLLDLLLGHLHPANFSTTPALPSLPPCKNPRPIFFALKNHKLLSPQVLLVEFHSDSSGALLRVSPFDNVGAGRVLCVGMLGEVPFLRCKCFTRADERRFICPAREREIFGFHGLFFFSFFLYGHFS